MLIIINYIHLIAICPIRWIGAFVDQAVKSRILPITDPGYPAMFNRIEMHTILSPIANQVFPKSPLPNAMFTAFLPDFGTSLLWRDRL